MSERTHWFGDGCEPPHEPTLTVDDGEGGTFTLPTRLVFTVEGEVMVTAEHVERAARAVHLRVAASIMEREGWLGRRVARILNETADRQ